MTAPVRTAEETAALVVLWRSALPVAEVRARLNAERLHLHEETFQAAQAQLTADAVAAGEEAAPVAPIVSPVADPVITTTPAGNSPPLAVVLEDVRAVR